VGFAKAIRCQRDCVGASRHFGSINNRFDFSEIEEHGDELEMARLYVVVRRPVLAKGVLEPWLKHPDWPELEHQMRGNSYSNQVCNTRKRDVVIILTTVFLSVIASQSVLLSRRRD